MNDQPEVDWVESRHRSAPSSDTPDLGPWCCYADEVGMYGDGICSPEDPRHAPTHCGYDNVRRGLVPAPSSDTPAHSGRDGLTLREAAIEAILIREQDTAFPVVARHIAALFTSLDAIPSTCPTATCHGCPDPEACEVIRPTSSVDRRPYMEPSAVVDALEAMSATLPNITGTQAVQLLAAADYVRLHIGAAADRGEPTP